LETTELIVQEVMVLCAKAQQASGPLLELVVFAGVVTVAYKVIKLVNKKRGKKETDFVRTEDQEGYKAV
jgi:hypothetical protein